MGGLFVAEGVFVSINMSGGRTAVELSAAAVTGVPGVGGALLKFSIDYSVPVSTKQFVFENVRANVHLGRERKFVGFAFPEIPLRLVPLAHEQKRGILFELPLGYGQIEAIESWRSGGEMGFSIDVIGEVKDELNVLPCTERLWLTVSQQDWVRVLRQIGYASGIVFELPISLESIEGVTSVEHYLKKAKEHLWHGDYDGVVAKCRMALELIAGGRDELNAAKEAAKTNRKGMRKDERLLLAVDSLVHFTHLAHHPDTEGEYVPYSRSEALFVLGSTIPAVIAFLEKKRADDVGKETDTVS
jgi:hypothetical protein